jgi:hypothetical protein
MFYFEQDINEYLKCQICNNKLKDPKLLPCGESICERCIPVETFDSKKQCILCHEEHIIPVSGLPSNKSLERILEKTPVELYRGRYHKELKEKSNKFKKEIDQIKEIIEQPKELVKNNCNLLREQVKMSYECAEAKLAKAAEKLIKQINDYETDCLERCEENKEFIISSKTKLESMETLYIHNLEYINKPLIDHEETKDKINTTINKLIDILYLKVDLNLMIFSDDHLEYRSNNEEELDTHLIGELYDSNLYGNFDSTNILSNEILIRAVYKVCGLLKQDKWRLIYRATKDGFNAKAFHSKCDGKYLTLTLVKTKEGYIFGGYSEREWASDGSEKYDIKTKIFSLANKNNEPLRLEMKNNLIKCDSNYGPIFGSGPNLCIKFDEPSTTNLDNSYTNMHCQNENFEVEELEVFQCYINLK